MDIVFLDVDTVGNLPNLRDLQKFGNIRLYPTTQPDETKKRIESCEVVITNKVILNRKILQSARSLKLICVAATGTNNIDLEYCHQNNIEVRNAVNYSTHSVAQATFSSLLYLMHWSSYYDQYVKSRQYSDSPIFTHIHHDFHEIKNKNFGIVGLGHIGSEVAKIATAFGATVSYYSTSGKNDNQEYKRVELEELLTLSDIISIHAPLNENTKNLISEVELKKIKSDAILINMGRGGIIDEQALAERINKNKIGGVAIDVLSSEPIPKTHPLLSVKHPEKLYITPHNAWASLEARTLLIKIVCDHLKEYREYKRSAFD